MHKIHFEEIIVDGYRGRHFRLKMNSRGENSVFVMNGNTGKTISALDRDAGLAQGIYYYIAAVNGGEFSIQGYLYIDR